MPIFEVTAVGFDGGTDATDDRVFWVAAYDATDLQRAIEGTGAGFCDTIADEVADAGDIDFNLYNYGEAATLRAKLMEFRS